jgi:hypothetical protein
VAGPQTTPSAHTALVAAHRPSRRATSGAPSRGPTPPTRKPGWCAPRTR